jgi:hypothetical protein
MAWKLYIPRFYIRSNYLLLLIKKKKKKRTNKYWDELIQDFYKIIPFDGLWIGFFFFFK